MVYFAHFYSHISYSIIFWGLSSSMRNVFIIQKRAIRIMLRLVPRSSCREGLEKLVILKIPCIYIYALMLFVVKNLNIYQTNSSVHGTNTRQQNKWHIPSVGLSSLQRVVYYLCVKIFNQLPQNIFKYCNNMHTFKTLLRGCLVNNAFNSSEEFLSAGHNNVDIWTFIFNLFHYFMFTWYILCTLSCSYWFYVICKLFIWLDCTLQFSSLHEEFNSQSDLCG